MVVRNHRQRRPLPWRSAHPYSQAQRACPCVESCTMRYAVSLCLILLAILGFAASAAAAGDRPNVILIMTDDQGYPDLGCHGNPILKTPHLDAMASRSAVLKQFYVSPVCTPTRASLMTGRYN